jgi:diadenosine tetraphosphate (Ap4A) HIT family hydrolase
MDWDRLAAGDNCPFDGTLPARTDHWDAVARLERSTLCLLANQTYRGHCILVLGVHAVRIDQLPRADWLAYAGDLQRAVAAVMSITRADHVNVESLGNVVPHLHWHIVPRYKSDPRWGTWIYTTHAAAMPERRLAEPERAAVIEQLRAALR